ncbi:MAG: leucine-rich repeat protein [Clostridia bacterium]|nr:leucine-rich repeat protein [Clostridia bacterium]
MKHGGTMGRLLLLLTLCVVCLSGCTQEATLNTDQTQDNGTNAVYDAKITYYEACLQSMTEQINQMDQQIYVMRAEYKNRTDALEKELQVLRQSKAEEEDTPVVAPTEPSAGEGTVKTEKETISKKETETSTPPTEEESIPKGQKRSGDFLYCDTEGGVMLTKYLGENAYVSVPAAIDGKRVITLADSAFAETKVRSVYLPETVRELGWFTFYGCGELTSVTLPASITRIGYASFDGCGAELCLVVEKNSYAQQYAASFALRYMTLN